MKETKKTNKIMGSLLLGASVGGLIGAALGFLFAPEKGSKTRKKIQASGDELSGTMKNKFNDFLEEIKNEAGSVKGKFNELVENGKTKVDKLK